METNNHVISYRKIRRSIGFIGLLLPLVLWFGNFLLNSFGLATSTKWIIYKGEYNSTYNLKSSISHFYYSTVGEIFTGALCAVALFLFCYKGYERPKSGKYKWFPGDNFIANLAAILAIGVVLFPTAEEESIKDNFRAFTSTELTGIIHYIFAGLFFLTLSLMSIVNFRRTGDPKTFGKEKPHTIYLWCGIIMIVCMLLLFSLFIMEKAGVNINWANEYKITYWFETIMLLAFGSSWLIKGKVDEAVFKKNLFGHGEKKSANSA